VSGFLAHLAARSLGQSPAVQPRLPSRFEPPAFLPGAARWSAGDPGEPGIVEREEERPAPAPRRGPAAGPHGADRRPPIPEGQEGPERREPFPAPAVEPGRDRAAGSRPALAPETPRPAAAPGPPAPHPTVARPPAPVPAGAPIASIAPTGPAAAAGRPAAWPEDGGGGEGVPSAPRPAPAPAARLAPSSVQPAPPAPGPVVARPEVMLASPPTPAVPFAPARPAAEPVIRVTIGRVEVRAVTEAAAPAAARPHPAAAPRGGEPPGLAEYLERRARRP